MMARRTPRALALSLFALFFVVALAGCGDDAGPVAPAPTTIASPEADRPKTEPPIPSTARTEVFESDDRCALPGSYARFVRVMEGIGNGRYTLAADAGWIVCGEAPDDPFSSFTWSETPDGFTWSSTVPVGAVVLWSGRVGVVHHYATATRGDQGLRGPTDPETGEAMPVDALTLCHDYGLDVELDLSATGSSAASWSIDADVVPVAWDLMPGDRATSRAVVTLERSGGDGADPRVTGTITISNPTPFLATVTDAYVRIGEDTRVALNLPLPLTLMAGQRIPVYFERTIDAPSPIDCEVVVETEGDVRGDTASTTFDLGADVVEIVTSDGQRLGPFASSQQVVVSRVFTADDVSGASADLAWDFAVDGVADVVDRHVVSIRVHRPNVDVAISTRSTRTWDWSLTVEPDHTTRPGLDPFDGSIPMRARIVTTLDAGSGLGLGGSLSIANPHPIRSMVVRRVAVEVDGVTYPLAEGLTVDANDAVGVALDVDLDGPASTATLVVESEARDLDWDGTSAPGEVASFTRDVSLAFDRPVVVDATARLSDSAGGDLGVVTAGPTATSVPFTVAVDPAQECGAFTVAGRAELVTVDRQRAVAHDWSFVVDVPCEAGGCTRTSRAWLRHREDPVWDQLPEGPRTQFLNTRYRWIDVLDPRTRGGVYRRLAAEYAAARLNEMAGADTATIDLVLARAEQWLREHDPRRLRGRDVKDAVLLTLRLWRFNSGRLGPEACQD